MAAATFQPVPFPRDLAGPRTSEHKDCFLKHKIARLSNYSLKNKTKKPKQKQKTSFLRISLIDVPAIIKYIYKFNICTYVCIHNFNVPAGHGGLCYFKGK